MLASGNLGLVYGTRRETRVTLEEMENVLPGMLEGLVAHEGVGFAMVHSRKYGPVVIGASGRNYLAKERVDGDGNALFIQGVAMDPENIYPGVFGHRLAKMEYHTILF